MVDQSGSTCEGCYALSGNYRFGNVQRALEARLEAWRTDPDAWRCGMVELIADHDYFRWFDSGDLQSVGMLRDIAWVCRRTPSTLHWLPTREYGIVRRYRARHRIPGNLTIRLSALWVDQPGPQRMGLPVSTVHSSDAGLVQIGEKSRGAVRDCPSRHQNNECGDCRACWSRDVATVSYHRH